MTVNRPFATMVPSNADIYFATVSKAGIPQFSSESFSGFLEEFVEEIPVHPSEAEDVARVRKAVIELNGKTYWVFRGDLHRHTDISQDFKYDGSLLEVYRYAIDAAALDFIAPTDHQAGYDQEYTWWISQKLADGFHLPGGFVPLFAYERSVPYPNGHRNVLFAQRGVRTLPIPEAEQQGKVGAGKLFEYLRQNRGLSIPHSIATDQGTNWRETDEAVEPVVEIYQGYRASYEYEGAPKAASRWNLFAQKSGWQPSGFYWNALKKGYRLGVIASSDHWSTHMSYACLIAQALDRESLFQALLARHSYGATDNIFLDYKLRCDGKTLMTGDSGSCSGPAEIDVRVVGTGPIRQIDVIRDGKFIYTLRPLTAQAQFRYVDQGGSTRPTYYDVRVLQQDEQIAWSSPIWLR